MSNFEELIESLPSEFQEKIAIIIAKQQPHFINTAIETLATANFDCQVKVRVYWNSDPADSTAAMIRKKIDEELIFDIEAFDRAIMQYLKQSVNRKISEFSKLQDKAEAEKNGS